MTSAQELSCIFCKESFGDKESLQTHFRKHGDPKFNQATKAKLRVQSNSPTSSDTSRDDVEMVSCDVCNEVFPTISKAITHKHKIHPDYDAKYFCPWCGKLFTLKFLYNKHLESSHESMPKVTNCFHCDCCDVDFFLPCAMVYHNKFYHRQEKDATSIGFSKKVKFLCQELVQIYYCPFCGEEYENKVNLNKHMEDEHSDENQCPEDILRCPLCEAVFYHLDAYELHLTFHSSEDLYSEENEMLKQIVEFSLDTVPPLMEKLEIPPTPEDNDAMGVDQFLQLSMCKESDEQPDHTEKVKSKKHKKHKKSKKTITLDEFLNMNTDLFGEGLNIQGIEEVPTRVVTKQLKPKKEPVLKNLKNKPLPTNIDKLQKQGITIKMKSGNKIVPNEIKQPISTPPISTPKNSNVISTSSEVLSRLMNQSNNQIKIVKKTAASNTNVDYDIKESNNTITSKNEEMDDVAYNEEFSEATENMSANNNTEASTSETDKDKNEEENKPENDNETIQDKDKINKSPLSTETASNPLKEKASNVTSDNNYEINDTNCTSRSDDNSKNQETIAENPSSITNTNDTINFEKKETLDDFEESLIANKIPRTENTTKESQNNGETKKSLSEKNETIIDQKEKANNTLNAIKHLSHLITVKPVQSKPSPKGEDGETNNKSSHDQIEDLNDEINYEDEDDEDNIPISKLENKKDKPKDLNPLKNLSKNVTVKSLTSQMTTSKLDQFNHDSDDLDSTDSTNKSITNNIVGRKVVNLGNRSRTETIIKNSQTESPTQGTTKKLKVRKTVENNSQPNSPNENTRLNTSNADLLKRLTNVTAKPISSKLSIKPTAQTVEQSATVKKEHFTERVKKQGKINEEIEIFNIDDSDSDDQNKLYENEPKNTKLAIKSVDEIKETKIAPPAKSLQALRNLSKNITVKSNAQTIVTRSSEENISDENKTFSEDEDFEQNNVRDDQNMEDFIDESHKILQSTLKNLSKNLTVKSRNSQNLPNIRKLKFNNRQQNERFSNNESDSESEYAIGKVKVTEITDHNSEEEFPSADESKNFVQSPNSNNSDVEDHFADEDQHFSEDDNDSHHINIKIKSNEHSNQSATPLRHAAATQQECDNSPLNKFKKLNKEITIRSVNENKRTNRNTENEEANTSKDISNNANKEMSSKPYKQNISKQIKSEHQTSTTANEKAGSNQVSTVNKEVSVKTYQSQTVIEEITTTVTKTIRTVNQTVKQEVNNTQVNTNPTFKPNKIANFNPSKIIQKPTTIRNSSQNIGTKVVNIASTKPTTSGIRPANQLAPIRPGPNVTKVGNFRVPVVRNVTPKPSQNTIACRTLKISPQAMNQSMKRPSQDSQGQLSCFKKPKESIMETQKSGEQGEMHMTATQNKSDFTSTVKSMKGKTLVTSTQMKSEMSSSAHLSKIGNMSGIKIVKTSSKQSTQVEGRVESSNAKRTMEALQKLQMQGLLVKRPRIEENDKVEEENDFSNSGSENDDDT